MKCLASDTTSRLKLIYFKKTDRVSTTTFNKVLDDIDTKVLGQDHAKSVAHWSVWKANTEYAKGDVVRWQSMLSNQYAKCITGGYSGNTEPITNVLGTNVTDNSAIWTIEAIGAPTANSGINIWLGGTNYNKGDAVLYKGALYRCKAEHTATTFDVDHDTKWQDVSANVKTWQTITYYNEGDTVLHNSVLYRCNTAHTSSTSFDDSKFDLVGDFYGIKVWASDTKYTVGRLVLIDNVLYRCKTTHTSNASANVLSDMANWELVYASIDDWREANYYGKNVVIEYNNQLYKCKVGHNSSTKFEDDLANWDILDVNLNVVNDWAKDTYYYKNQIIFNNGVLYRCNTAHKSLATFEADEGAWERETKSVDLWSPSTYYDVGSEVLVHKSLYRCITKHTSSADFQSDLTNWYQISSVVTDWKPSEDYKISDIVINDSDFYRCVKDHTSSADFSTDRDCWKIISKASASLVLWEANTEYLPNQLTVYKGVIYVCKNKHTSAPNFIDNADDWEVITANLLDWNPTTYYLKDTVVIYEKSLYRAKANHTSSVDFETDRETLWELIANVPTIVEPWEKYTYYYKHQLAIIDNALYKCIEAHTSDSTVNYLKWNKLNADACVPSWNVLTDYPQGALVLYHNAIFFCVNPHTSTSNFDDTKDNWYLALDFGGAIIKNLSDLTSTEIQKDTVAKYGGTLVRSTETQLVTNVKNNWELIANGDIAEWASSIYYLSGQLVYSGDLLFKCINSHTSTTSLEADKANWVCIARDKTTEVWKTSQEYKQNQLVVYDNTLYRAIDTHTSSTDFPSDIAHWSILYSNIAEYQANKFYPIGATVSYNGGLYRCAVANKDPKFVADNWYSILDEITVEHEVKGKVVTKGMNVKVTADRTLVANNLLKSVRCATNTDEIDFLSSTRITNEEIFNSWFPISCDANGDNQNDNSDEQTATRASYSFNKMYDSIICNRDNSAFSAFISQEEYAPNYTVDYTIDNRVLNSVNPSYVDDDDDGLVYIIGYMVDDADRYHTLSVWRIGDIDNSHGFKFAIAYDLYSSWKADASANTLILAETDSLVPAKWTATAFANLQVVKSATNIIAKTSEIGSTNLSTIITFALPSTLPSGWTQTQYDNIKYMMENPVRVGFGTQSNASAFRLSSSLGSLTGVNVYNVNTLTKTYFEDGAEVSTERDTEVMLPEGFLYSELTKRLFFVESDTSVKEVDIVGRCKEWSEKTIYVKDAIVIYHDCFYRCLKSHMASSTFSADSALWVRVGGASIPTVPKWEKNKAYDVGNMVLNNDILYIVTSSHSSGTTFDATKFIQVGITKEQAIAYSLSL